MKDPFSPTCDRHGHILTGVGGSPQVMELFVFPTAEEMAFLPGAPDDSVSAPRREVSGNPSKKRKLPFRIRKILVPVDSERTDWTDLIRVIQLARRLDAQITLLHCYEAPRSFSYARGDSGFDDVIRHRELSLMRLRTLSSVIRRSWSKCLWLFEEGDLLANILRVSKRMRADLIAVAVSLDAASESWSTIEVTNELVRKADCPVLAGKAITSGQVRQDTSRRTGLLV
jgi:nucleotide-binding universal stress UspA family protein